MVDRRRNRSRNKYYKRKKSYTTLWMLILIAGAWYMLLGKNLIPETLTAQPSQISNSKPAAAEEEIVPNSQLCMQANIAKIIACTLVKNKVMISNLQDEIWYNKYYNALESELGLTYLKKENALKPMTYRQVAELLDEVLGEGDLLKDKVALITGGDSGIGRSVAVAFAKQGANIGIVYYNETKDAALTQKAVEKYNRKCLLLQGDLSQPNFCNDAVNKIVQQYGRLDVLINNAAVQYEANTFTEISDMQFDKTFKTNVYSTFYLTKAALPHLKAGASIINTTSVVAFHGHDTLIDYSMTKGALTAFTRSLAMSLSKSKSGVRVNAVAPGPIWTPLIPSSFDAQKVSQFGSNTPMGRAGQPIECSGAYVFLASEAASYITGQTIHINGGEIVNA